MGKSRNSVIAGDYSGITVQVLSKVGKKKGLFSKEVIQFPAIVLKATFKSIDTWEYVPLTNDTVEAIELVTDEHRKSAASGIARGLVGGALLGSVGMLAGTMSAKEKGIYHVAVQFKDGKRSLLELDDTLFNSVSQMCF